MTLIHQGVSRNAPTTLTSNDSKIPCFSMSGKSKNQILCFPLCSNHPEISLCFPYPEKLRIKLSVSLCSGHPEKSHVTVFS